MAATAAFIIGAPSANASKPLDVDCDLLAATNDAVNDILDGAGTQFANVGELISDATLDEGVFNALSALILLASGGRNRFYVE